RCVDVGGSPFEVTAQGVQEVRERSCVEVLRAIRVVACLLPTRVERRLQLANSPFTLCLGPPLSPLERLQACTQLANHLTPRLGQRQRLFPGRGELRAPAEV